MQAIKAHVRKGETVMVIAGKEKTKTGKVLQFLPKKDSVIVEGLNMVKRHMKARGNEPGGIKEKEAGIHISNVLPYCSKCSTGVRTRKLLLENGDKQRICVKCGNSLEK
ncbi:MAG: 50S ribosomal protein L24 [Geobacteraceae bacterium GWC2_48_7]|jgi:large subunit ribosomal protein L24|nr:MAG: 50S ribosomal protein L24 [Geobacteraceae bacterium GWC2_48_7]